MEDSFRVRVDRVFGSLVSSSPSNNRNSNHTPPSSSSLTSLWSLSDQEIERKEWKRDSPDCPPRSPSPPSNLHHPLLSSSSSFSPSTAALSLPPPHRQHLYPDRGNYDHQDHIRNNEEQEEDNPAGKGHQDHEDGQDWDIRSSIGLDCTLDFEDEEDEYDKVAVGREKAGDILCMGDVVDYGIEVNAHNELPSSFKDAPRDPRANHMAAKLRLREDAEAAGDFDTSKLSEMCMSSLTNRQGQQKVEDLVTPKPILRKRENPIHKKSPKRVRFHEQQQPNLGPNDSALGTCSREEISSSEEALDLPGNQSLVVEAKASDVESSVPLKSSSSGESALLEDASTVPRVSNYIPDYLRNPTRYTRYDLASSYDTDEESNRKAYMEFLNQVNPAETHKKKAMKKLAPSQQVLHRIYDARQLALKLIANVTYGYTAAGFSGRMPCAELADSIVQCGRRTLEAAISFVSNHNKWKAKVVYGDTDSMFVLLKGRSRREAFHIGNEIVSAISAMNPNPVVLKMEKVYQPCFLLTKKRYVGYSYESPDQSKPKFDAKGIETVRRDTCDAVSKTMEQSLRLYFEHQDIDKVKAYLLRQWTRIISGRVSLQDFVFAKEVCLGTYSSRASSLPPSAIVATKAMRADPRAEPRYAERVPYVVVHGEPGARLVDMVVDPMELLALDSRYRLNEAYYIRKQIIPALQRVFGLVGADLNQWFSDMPRPERETVGKRHFYAPNQHRTRIDYYYLSRHCILCGSLVQASSYFCHNCSKSEATVATALIGRTAKLEKEIQHLAAICRHCGGGDWLLESGVKCTSLACSIFYERRKVQKELKSLAAAATELGFYPTCMAEWF